MGVIENTIEKIIELEINITGVSLPLVTVIVTNYNYENFIADCLRSISEQTYKNFECIVVDDVSTDDSVTLINDFINNENLHEQFLLVKHETNEGQLSAFKTGLSHAKGEFIVFVDADDLLLKNFISVHVKTHLSYLPVAFTSSNQYQINARGWIIGGLHPDLQTQDIPLRVITLSLFSPIWVWATTSSMMFRKSTLEVIMPENSKDYRICADNYICHFSNLIGGSILLPDILGCYRRHGNNFFSNNPLLGLKTPTGDMREHPSHSILLKNIHKHVLSNYELFAAQHTERGVVRMLSKVTTPRELLNLVCCKKARNNMQFKFGLMMRLIIFSLSKYTKYIIRKYISLKRMPGIRLDRAAELLDR